jgi:F0F1-type ATP synthase assembly protein I
VVGHRPIEGFLGVLLSVYSPPIGVIVLQGGHLSFLQFFGSPGEARVFVFFSKSSVEQMGFNQLYYTFTSGDAETIVDSLLEGFGPVARANAPEQLRTAVSRGVFVHDDLATISELLRRARNENGGNKDGNSLPTTLTEFLKAIEAKPQLGLPAGAGSPSPQTQQTRFPAHKTLGEMTEEEKEAWREAMRARAAHRDYNTLTRDVRWREVEQAKAEGFATYRQQLSIGMNVIVSLITACVFGWFMGKHLVDQHNKAGPWIVSAAFGVGLLMVEAILIITRLGKADAERRELQERALRGDADALAATQTSLLPEVLASTNAASTTTSAGSREGLRRR